MAAAMLATYPELFAGGAIIAGLPHGVAHSVPQALERMRGQGLPSAAALSRAVHDASPHRGPWPSVSVWHGSADATVVPAAGEAVVAQWLGVHGLADAPPVRDTVGSDAHRVWHDADGRVLVEAHVIAGMGHGTPLDPQDCGAAGAHMLDVGVSSTLRIAESWGLAQARPRAARPSLPRAEAASGPSAGVGRIIEDALRTAGLMR
jgi:poly(3-hydroxybutyrate) depolymerase